MMQDTQGDTQQAHPSPQTRKTQATQGGHNFAKKTSAWRGLMESKSYRTWSLRFLCYI